MTYDKDAAIKAWEKLNKPNDLQIPGGNVCIDYDDFIIGFEQGAKWERERIRERLFDIKKKIAWIGMNSGIAADRNHVDPIQAHKENYEKITYMLEAIDELLGEKS